MNNRRRNFTLVELLVVIGIIAILAGMLMAGIMYAPAKAQKAKAQAEITTLVNAIKQYEATYGVLPIPDHSISHANTHHDVEITTASNGTSNTDYEKLILILQADDPDNSSSPWNTTLSATERSRNKRKTKFLEVKGNTAGEYKDPWGNDYQVYLDANYDGKIQTDSNIPGMGTDTYRYNVVVYSSGHDKKDSGRQNGQAKHDEDNVYSFPTTWSSNTERHTISR